jgi:hypothetical protein
MENSLIKKHQRSKAMPQQLDPTVLTSAGHTPSFQITQILCSIHSKLQLPELSAESTHERQFT